MKADLKKVGDNLPLGDLMGEGEVGFLNLAESRWQACMALLGLTRTKDSEQQRTI